MSRGINALWAVMCVGVCTLVACEDQPVSPRPPALFASAGQDPEITQALEQARARLLAAPMDLALRREYALVLDANGLDSSAQLAWQQVTQLAPGEARAWYHLSKVSERNGKFDLSFNSIQRCVELDPNYAAAQARLGRLSMEGGELEAAEKAFQNARTLDPQSPRGALGLARLWLARGQAEDVIALLEALLARNPREPYVNALLARAHVLGGRPERAEPYLAAEQKAGAATGRDPWTADLRRRATGKITRISRAKSALARGDAKAALAQMQPLWERRQTEQSVLETLCEVRLAMGQPQQVLDLLDETASGFDQAYSLLLYRARAERELGFKERALAAAQEAALLNPRRMEAASFSGQLFFSLGRYPEAVTALALARENGDESLQGLAFLGRARGQAGDLEGGLKDLLLAVESYPMVPKPWAYRAELLALAGRHAEAQSCLARAADLGLNELFLAPIRERVEALQSDQDGL